MDILNNFVDNIVIPFLMIHGITLGIILISLIFIFQSVKNDKTQEVYDEDDYDDVNMEHLRDQIEYLDTNNEDYKILQSIVLPKKGDYVEIRYGRWNGYVGRITNVLCELDYSLYNINVSKKDNFSYGNDIPHFLLKNKSRDFFTVLTDNEIYNYNLLSDNEEMDRGLITEY